MNPLFLNDCPGWRKISTHKSKCNFFLIYAGSICMPVSKINAPEASTSHYWRHFPCWLFSSYLICIVKMFMQLQNDTQFFVLLSFVPSIILTAVKRVSITIVAHCSHLIQISSLSIREVFVKSALLSPCYTRTFTYIIAVERF